MAPMMLRARGIAKSFVGIFFAVTLPTFIMIWIFLSGDISDWTSTKVWWALFYATVAMLLYGFLVSMIGVKKYVRRG